MISIGPLPRRVSASVTWSSARRTAVEVEAPLATTIAVSGATVGPATVIDYLAMGAISARRLARMASYDPLQELS
jgi:hypothetical protein